MYAATIGHRQGYWIAKTQCNICVSLFLCGYPNPNQRRWIVARTHDYICYKTTIYYMIIALDRIIEPAQSHSHRTPPPPPPTTHITCLIDFNFHLTSTPLLSTDPQSLLSFWPSHYPVLYFRFKLNYPNFVIDSNSTPFVTII